MIDVAFSKDALRTRPSIPGPGSSLVAAAETRAVHVRAAVESVRRSFDDCDSVHAGWRDVLASRWRAERPAHPRSITLQAAWALVSMRIVGRHVGALPARASLRDGESWFLGNVRLRNRLSDTVGEFADREAVQQLESFEYDDDLGDLLPYVLDAYGPGSRASVMKDPGTQPSRQAKRAAGVFYTPSDVAEYIARETLGGVGHTTPHRRVLDPACGSAVFLKAVLDLTSRRKPDMNRLDFAERNLHGIDINPLAVESACFVLLHECLRAGDGQPGESPWACWHRVRCNLCVADALTFQIATPHPGCADDLAHLRSRLAEGYVSPAAEPLDADGSTMLFPAGRTLGNVFPALSAGAEIVIGNPPYARIGRRDDTAALKRRFETLSGDVAASDYFPVFIEMMWRFARTGCSASGMVAPLSLACSSRAQMTAARRAIMRSGGRWRFAFFDREPHALFGEEVENAQHDRLPAHSRRRRRFALGYRNRSAPKLDQPPARATLRRYCIHTAGRRLDLDRAGNTQDRRDRACPCLQPARPPCDAPVGDVRFGQLMSARRRRHVPRRPARVRRRHRVQFPQRVPQAP